MNIPALLAFSWAVSVGAAAASPAGENALERAVRAELGRAKRELRAEGYPGVYHAALTVWDLDDWDRWSAMGAARVESRRSQRIVMPDLRVGGAALDNHPVSPKNDYLATPVSMADDEYALRHALWRVLDGAYKSATADFLRKQERLVSLGKAEYDTDDLSPEPAVVRVSTRPASPWDLERLRRLEGALGEPFRLDPDLLYAESHVGLRRLWVRLRDTDGMAVDKAADAVKLDFEATALSSDGLRETVGRGWSARTPDALPSEDEVRRAGRELLADLRALRVAATTSPFSAPALLDPSVSAALVFALGQRLSGEELRNPSGAQTFRGRVGDRVLASDLTLVDDPTRLEFKGRPLFGHYEYDDHGVPARRATLVERGVLKGFLLSRYPVKNFPRSNGHGRAPLGLMPIGSPGVLFLTTADPQPVGGLLARLRERCRLAGKPYGLWIRNLRASVQQQGGGAQGSIRFIARVDLIPADGGTPVRVRDLDLVGTPLVMAGSVLAAGDDLDDSEVDAGAPATVIAPSLLLSEAELQRSETKPEKAPILPPPQPFSPEPARTSATRRVPFIPKGAQIQVDRYLISGRAELLESFDVPGVYAWRQTRTPDGLVLDVKVVGGNLKTAGAAARGVDAAVAALAKDASRRSVLSSLRALSAYRARFGDGWPDDGPR